MEEKNISQILDRIVDIQFFIRHRYSDGIIPGDQLERIKLKLSELEDEIESYIDGEDLFWAYFENRRTFFDKEQIRKILRLRLITQDRFANTGCNILYPIYFIKCLYKKANRIQDFDEIINSIIDNIKFFVKLDDKNTELRHITISQIESLIIKVKDNRIVVKTKGSTYTLWDPPKNDIEAEPMNVREIKFISIDHDKDISKLLEEISNSGEEYEIKKISANLHDQPFDSKEKYSNAIKEKIVEYDTSQIDFDKLGKEISELNKELSMLSFYKNCSSVKKQK